MQQVKPHYSSIYKLITFHKRSTQSGDNCEGNW